MTTPDIITETPPWDLLFTPLQTSSPINNKVKKVHSIRLFNESLKRTFVHLWEAKNKREWMSLIQIFKILDTFHFFNLLEIYDKNAFTRHNEINEYLKDIKGYNEKNCSYFITAIQHYLK